MAGLMFNGVSPLAQGARDLAAASRLMTPVLERLVRGGPRPVADVARELGVPEDDVRRAAFALEAAGLVESTVFRATVAGQHAVAD